MVHLFKLDKSDFQVMSPTGKFRLETVIPRLSGIAGAKHMSFDFRRLNPGSYSFPYHFHYNAEELFIIISGSATLRTPDGFQTVSEGDVVFFGMGEGGAHQLYNNTTEPCLYFDLKTDRGADLCEYPDSGKLGVVPSRLVFEKQTQVGYFKGEEDADSNWEKAGGKI